MRYYAFNANPDRYRVELAVSELDEDSWMSKGRPMVPGDRILIWKSYGKKGKAAGRGIVAFGEVLDFPASRTNPSPYWAHPEDGQVNAERVIVRYIKPSKLPLWERDFPNLRQLTVCGGQWLAELSPLAMAVSEQAQEVHSAFSPSTVGTDTSLLNGELGKYRRLAEALRQLPSPTSPTYRQIKKSYDSLLDSRFKLWELEVERKRMVIAWAVTASSARKLQKLEATVDMLERKISNDLEIIDDFDFEHQIDLRF